MQPLKPRERTVEAEIVESARLFGWDTIKLAKTEIRGRPDRIFLRRGETRFLEIKRFGERPDRQQMKRINELRQNGFQAGWCDTVEDGLAFLR